ncbi:MAG: GntR family transcriptional regulator [Solobacterium sp.]|nr:GntR family transcriptional regulator [uncultured Solobacterium sp.]MBF1071884.1 GntR family transcriptional regulator [Solobacterium sp.]MBF1086364.1 GntR family transcriptional regulator [Solobacterium sp.]MBF1103404.1 GntR family transcriptional regulator [Solobacterium sp.]
MSWEFRSDQAIYPQLVSIIKRRIVTGVYPAGSKLPSVRELAEESGVNPNTMQRALTGLEQEGLVYTQRTAGRFVSEDKSMLDGIKGEEAKSLTAEYYAKLKKLGYSKTQMIDFINMQGEE